MPPKKHHNAYNERKRHWKRGKRRNNYYNDNRETSQQSEPSNDGASASNNQDSDEYEIPGFYYDKVKKRYFKILPGHNQNKNAVTKDTIKAKENEIKRQNDLKTTEIAVASTIKNRTAPCKIQKLNIVSCLACRSLNSYARPLEYKRDIIKLKIKKLQPVCKPKTVQCDIGLDKYEHIHLMAPNLTHDKILCLWSYKDSLVQKLQVCRVENKSVTSLRQPRHIVQDFDVQISQSMHKITHACWAEMDSSGNPDCEYVLYTAMQRHLSLDFRGRNDNSVAILQGITTKDDGRLTLTLDRPGDQFQTSFNLSKNVPWTCCWNLHKKMVGIGSEKCALLLDVQTRRMWELDSGNSDVLSQAFSDQTPHILYNGTRRGQIISNDIRNKTRCYTLRHKSSVCSIKLLKDNNYIVSSDFSGKICRWDVRMKKCVLEYPGHNNEYRVLPLQIHEEHELLYAAGQDCYTRFWHLHTGELLCKIPPPHPASTDSVPSVAYSNQWGNVSGSVGLILGMKDTISYYNF